MFYFVGKVSKVFRLTLLKLIMGISILPNKNVSFFKSKDILLLK